MNKNYNQRENVKLSLILFRHTTKALFVFVFKLINFSLCNYTNLILNTQKINLLF